MNSSGTSHSSGGTVSRRNLLRYAAVAGAAAAAGPAVPASAAAHTHRLPGVPPPPKPIPGGLTIPGLPLLHVFPPGPPEVTLPFSGTTLQGLDVEPSVITDYTGFTALAFHAGSAVGSDGKRYNLETDIRAIEGTYVAANGSRTRATFGLI
jgi:hypothetical protein